MSFNTLKEIHVVAAIIHFEDKILATKRKAGGPSGEKWEFPGGKIEPGESSKQALSREIMEELKLTIRIGNEVGTFSTPLESFMIHLQCFHAYSNTMEVTLNDHTEMLWINQKAQLNGLDWALPDLPVLEHLQLLNDWRIHIREHL